MAEKLIIATTMAEAASLKNSDSAFLAGGTEINRLGSSVAAATLVSIGRIEDLDGISIIEDQTPACSQSGCSKEGKILRIGAMCTFQDVVESDLVPAYLKEACRFMASRTKRNMATIGGNVALKRDDSYLYPTLLAAGAKLQMLDRDGNTVYKCTKRYLESGDLYRDNLIVAILLPLDAGVVCSKRIANTAQSHAALTVSVGCKDGKVRLGAAIKNTALVYMAELSEKLCARDMDDKEILDAVCANKSLVFEHDIFGSPEYKRYLLSVIISDLAKQAKGGKR